MFILRKLLKVLLLPVAFVLFYKMGFGGFVEADKRFLWRAGEYR
ncbi:hypothetical protein [Butyrivibrio sp.]|nr:hypothetical protein [Butyrivibrio sp.]